MDFALDYTDVFNAVLGAVEGKSFTANGQTVSVPTIFANRQPALRNARTEPSYPGLVVRLFPPVVNRHQVIEPARLKLTLAAGAPYLDGVKHATIALADGQTLQITRWSRINGQQFSEVLTAVLSASAFSNIAAAKPLEIANALNPQLPGIKVTLRSGNTVRLEHDAAGAGSMLQITGGTAAALIATYPVFRVIGRDAGDQLRRVNPPIFFDFLYHVIHKTNRLDHCALVSRLVDRLFILPATHNERALQVAGNTHPIQRGVPVDDPMADEGVFVTAVPFTLGRVPIMLDESYSLGDNFRGGNYDGSGRQPLRQAPLEISLALEIEQLE